MKNTLSIIAAALTLFTAASCTKDTPVPAPAPDHFTITAEIEQTRVSYEDSDSGLKQAWEVGDKLVGFHFHPSEYPAMTFTVASVNDGVATLTTDSTLPSSGSIFLAYVPGFDSEPFNKGQKEIDLKSQTAGGKVPALMTSCATITDNGINFVFRNDCAIIEISDLQGLTQGKEISKITVDGVVLEGTYNLDAPNQRLTLRGSSSTSTLTYTDADNWIIGENGKISGRILLAIIPNSSSEDITVTATATDGSTYSKVLSAKTIQAGKCYRLQDCTLKSAASIGDLHFASLRDAISYSNTLTTGHEIVLQSSSSDAGDSPFTFASTADVTLDLNGCDLNLGNNSGISISGSASLTIKDSGTNGKVNGALSNSATILNAGTLTVESGTFVNSSGRNVISNTGTLSVNGGYFLTESDTIGAFANADDNGTITVTGGFFSTKSGLVANVPLSHGVSPTNTPMHSKGFYYEVETKSTGAVIRVDGVFYDSAAEAVAASNQLSDDHEFVLVDDVNANITIDDILGWQAFTNTSADVIFDLNSHTYTGAVKIENGANVTFRDRGNGGKLTNSYSNAILNYGTATIESGTYENVGETKIFDDNGWTNWTYSVLYNYGTLTMTGGNLIGDSSSIHQKSGTSTITGGTLKSQDDGIKIEGGKVNISGSPLIVSENGHTLYWQFVLSAPDVSITGGYLVCGENEDKYPVYIHDECTFLMYDCYCTKGKYYWWRTIFPIDEISPAVEFGGYTFNYMVRNTGETGNDENND